MKKQGSEAGQFMLHVAARVVLIQGSHGDPLRQTSAFSCGKIVNKPSA